MMAPPLILLHAFPLSPLMFDDLHHEMKIQFNSPAFPGFGGMELSQEKPSLGVLAQSILAFADAKKIDRFIVGGVSLGGYVAMELMRIAPARLIAAILIDTKAAEDAMPARANRERIARLALRHGTESLVPVMLPSLTGKTTKAEKPEVVQKISEIFRQSDPASIAWTQRAMAVRPNSFSTLETFNRPLLVIVGEEDEIASVDEARQMTGNGRFGQLAIVEGAGHLAVMEQTAKCAHVIERWASEI
ncbi:MAG TPA: alpha/beta hydrolase [Candidatus Nanopelagicaceae bacterium]|nr:alpha/beta hydrolase [Candidatus Nanopelagicaceae bacterium]